MDGGTERRSRSVQQEYSFQPLAKQKSQKEPLQQVIRSKTSLISPEAPPSARYYVKVSAACGSRASCEQLLTPLLSFQLQEQPVLWLKPKRLRIQGGRHSATALTPPANAPPSCFLLFNSDSPPERPLDAGRAVRATFVF